MSAIRNLLIVSLVAFLADNACSQEWTRFRGPNGDGNSDANIPASWSVDDYQWEIDLPGIGHSSPVIWGDRLFIQSADPDSGKQFLLCLDTKTGKENWRQEFESKAYHIHNRNSFASSTPSVDGNSVYFAFATPDRIRLYAYSHVGEQRWTHEDLGPYESQHGFGSSPIVVEDLVILPNLQMPSKDRGVETSAVLAFNKTTGEPVWSTPRTSGKSSYSVPCVHTGKNGKPELLLCSTTHGMFGLDLATGQENWSANKVFKMRTVSSPVIVGDLVFGSTGSGGGGNYVAAINKEDGSVAYKVTRQAPYVPTSVAHGDLVFLWYDKGVVTCIDAPTGNQHWSKRVGGNYSGSPVCVGSKVFCIAEDGQVVVLAASKDYKLLGKTALGEDSRSTPSISDGTMYLRTNSKLFALGSE